MLDQLFKGWMHFVQDWGYAGTFLLTVIGFTVFPIPIELVVPSAAYWATQGATDLRLVVLVAALGDMDRFDLDRLRALAAPHEVFVIGRGDGGDLGADLDLPTTLAIEEAAQAALRALTAAGVLPAPAA